MRYFGFILLYSRKQECITEYEREIKKGISGCIITAASSSYARDMGNCVPRSCSATEPICSRHTTPIMLEYM